MQTVWSQWREPSARTPVSSKWAMGAADEIAREIGFQKGAGVVDVGEGRLEQLVVGLVERALGHTRKWEQRGMRQRKECDDFVKMRREQAERLSQRH